MKITNKTKVGAFVLIVAMVLLALSLRACNFDFAPEGYKLKVQFKDIDGIARNAPVSLNGFEVGRVQDIHILYGQDTTRVELTMWLHAHAKLHQGAKAYVKNMGFMGEKYIALTSGDEGTGFIPADSVLIGEEPADFQKILVEGQDVATNLKNISTQLNERLKVNSQSIDETMLHLASISKNIDERLAVNKEHIDSMAGALSRASQNFEEMSFDLKQNPWKLLYRPKKEYPRLTTEIKKP